MLTIAPQLAAKGIKEQRLVIARGHHGCLDGTIHSIMRYLVLVLGKRNEHERGDRAKYIQLLPENLTPGQSQKTWRLNEFRGCWLVHFAITSNTGEFTRNYWVTMLILCAAGGNAYRLYTAAEAIWALFPYDYCSVTHAAQTDYAQPGKLAFMVLQAPFFIPKLNRLSETDCRLLLLLYSGDPAACSPCKYWHACIHVSASKFIKECWWKKLSVLFFAMYGQGLKK